METMAYVRRIRDLREDSDLHAGPTSPPVLGTSQTMYARYERGANELPIRHLIKLCALYGVSADYILGPHRRRGGRRGDEKRIAAASGIFEIPGRFSSHRQTRIPRRAYRAFLPRSARLLTVLEHLVQLKGVRL